MIACNPMHRTKDSEPTILKAQKPIAKSPSSRHGMPLGRMKSLILRSLVLHRLAAQEETLYDEMARNGVKESRTRAARYEKRHKPYVFHLCCKWERLEREDSS